MKIYGDLSSGNCLKVKYTCDHLGLAYQWVDVDIMKNESRTPAAMARNPQGQVPVIELDDGRTLAQSNAIIRFLARGSSLLPDDPFLQAKVDEWLFWEQNTHEPTIAVCRFHMVYLKRTKDTRDLMRVQRGEAALDVMERELATRPWFAAGAMTVADIALLAYTRLAPEGGFDLSDRSNIRAWIARCERALAVNR